MSAFGPKRTPVFALHMSAFGGKADMTVCGNPLSRSLFGAKRTCLLALHMSAFDPKRTLMSVDSLLATWRQAFKSGHAVRNEVERLTFRREDRHLRTTID
jgi:hypothetical protein